MKHLVFALLSLMAVFLTSCGPYHFRSPGVSEGAPISILRNGQPSLRLYEIDGKGPRHFGASWWHGMAFFNDTWSELFEVVIEPGRHTLKVNYFEKTGSNVGKRTDYIILSFDALSGHSYKIVSWMNADISRWTARIIDENSDKYVHIDYNPL